MKSQLFTIAIAAFVALLSYARSYANEAKSEQQINVLLLASDDLNSWLLGDTNRYAGKVVAPNLTKLAESGVNFKRAYTAAPVCSPSRTAFFSGVAPWKSGHYHNTPGAGVSKPLKNALSLAGFFKRAGYTTAGYGKITHGWDQGEHWDEKIGHKRDPAPPAPPLTPSGRGEQDWGPIHLAEGEMNDTLNADNAIRRLQQEHDQPFFICCGLFNPHMPWYVPKKYFDMFPLDEVTAPTLLENDLDDVPEWGVELTLRKGKYVDSIFEHGLHNQGVQAYLATTAYADAQLGRVLDALDKSPHRDNTVVVFLTDHGFHLAEKHHWQKATLWEEATHSLLMIRAGRDSRRWRCVRAIRLAAGHLPNAGRALWAGAAGLPRRAFSRAPVEKFRSGLAKHRDHRLDEQGRSDMASVPQHPQRNGALHSLCRRAGGILRYDQGPA